MQSPIGIHEVKYVLKGDAQWAGGIKLSLAVFRNDISITTLTTDRCPRGEEAAGHCTRSDQMTMKRKSEGQIEERGRERERTNDNDYKMTQRLRVVKCVKWEFTSPEGKVEWEETRWLVYSYPRAAKICDCNWRRLLWWWWWRSKLATWVTNK